MLTHRMQYENLMQIGVKVQNQNNNDKMMTFL